LTATRYAAIIEEEVAVWRNSSALVSISEVTVRRAWLVLGWTTFSARYRPLRSTQPGRTFAGRPMMITSVS